MFALYSCTVFSSYGWYLLKESKSRLMAVSVLLFSLIQYIYILLSIIFAGFVRRIFHYASNGFTEFTESYRIPLYIFFLIFSLINNNGKHKQNMFENILWTYCVVLFCDLLKISILAILNTVYAACLYYYDITHFLSYIKFVLPWYLKNRIDPSDDGQILWWIKLLTKDEFIIKCAEQHERTRSIALKNRNTDTNKTNFSVQELSYYSGAILTQYLLFGDHVILNEIDHHILSAFIHIMDDYCDFEDDYKENKYNHFNNHQFAELPDYIEKTHAIFKKHKFNKNIKKYILQLLKYPLCFHNSQSYYYLLQKFKD